MSENKQELLDKYFHFIREVVASGIVYCLKDEKDYIASCTSSQFETQDDEDEEVGVLAFWSDKEKAQACKQEEWADYKISEIPLAEFMESWCLGMLEEDVVAGINFDTELFGYEEHPIHLLKTLIDEVEANDTKLEFQSFSSLNDLKDYVNDLEKE